MYDEDAHAALSTKVINAVKRCLPVTLSDAAAAGLSYYPLSKKDSTTLLFEATSDLSFTSLLAIPELLQKKLVQTRVKCNGEAKLEITIKKEPLEPPLRMALTMVFLLWITCLVLKLSSELFAGTSPTSLWTSPDCVGCFKRTTQCLF